MTAPPASALTFTGERFTPEVRGAIWYEHWHRYAVTVPLAAGKRVLDAACGEGYGSFLLAQAAESVVGVDVDASAIAHAKARYAHDRVDYRQASVTALPCDDASMDLVVSFETIEHLDAQQDMLAEFRRVLAPGGALVLSSPNRPVYNEDAGEANYYHVKELDRAELHALLDPLFPRQEWHAQRVAAHSILWAEDAAGGAISYDVLPGQTAERRPAPAAPMYFVVVAGSSDATLPRLPALSLFDDGNLSLWRDYARANARERELAWDELDARTIAEDRLAELVASVNALSSEREKAAVLGARVASLEERLRVADESHARALREVSETLAHERAAHAGTQERLSYRETPAGWVRWPLSVARRRWSGAT